MKKKCISVILLLALVFSLTACDGTTVTMNASDTAAPSTEDGDPVDIVLEAAFYDNRGNNFITFQGNEFNIAPNKAKRWGYNTEGSWTSWYETASVLTVTVDGYEMPTCGSTILFYDTRVNLQPVDPDMLGTYGKPDGSGYEIKVEDSAVLKDWFALSTWWYDQKEKGQHGKKLVFIQSQDGYDIGIAIGDDVTWEIADRLPKTTLIYVDGMPLYIHRCNFIVIPVDLLEKAGAKS